jgi:gliding-associated putative ABC transporter substrate-binding component GldG
MKMKTGKLFHSQLIWIPIIAACNILAYFYFIRIDLTADGRYTLSKSTIEQLKSLEEEIFIKVYLEGKLPPRYERLSRATREFLDECKIYAGEKIQYEFTDVLSGTTEVEQEKILDELRQKGLQPTLAQDPGESQYQESLVIPGATVQFANKETAVDLLRQGITSETALNNSVSQLENSFLIAIENVTQAVLPKVGLVSGHGEWKAERLADWLMELSKTYMLEEIPLPDVLRIEPQFSAIIIAKPTMEFSEKDKYKIDQYIMNGGRVIWLVESLQAEMDSIVRHNQVLTVDYPLNLTDQLFTYGVRLNYNLLLDIQCNPVPLLVNYKGDVPQFRNFPCQYFPVLTSTPTHIINRNVNALMSEFTCTLDTLNKAGIKKTVLLHSSDSAKSVNTPWLIDFRQLRQPPVMATFNKQKLITGILLEGNFPSVFKNRLAPESIQMLNDSLNMPFKELSPATKMIILTDGDLARNDLFQGRLLPLGIYRFDRSYYFGNKDFMVNCMNYLTGHEKFIETRSKLIQLRQLNEAKVRSEKVKWQLINLLFPVAFFLFAGALYFFIHRAIYSKKAI